MKACAMRRASLIAKAASSSGASGIGAAPNAKSGDGLGWRYRDMELRNLQAVGEAFVKADNFIEQFENKDSCTTLHVSSIKSIKDRIQGQSRYAKLHIFTTESNDNGLTVERGSMWSRIKLSRWRS